MTNEQAVERCHQLLEGKHSNWIGLSNQRAISMLIDMLKERNKIINEQLKENVKLQKELNEENKRCMILENNDKFKEQVIDLMAEWISERCFYIDEYINSCEVIQDSCYKEKNCKDCLKQYFANKVNSKIQ